jgi:hypothetical protein
MTAEGSLSGSASPLTGCGRRRARVAFLMFALGRYRRFREAAIEAWVCDLEAESLATHRPTGSAHRAA